jgi:hypothetical protein
VRVTGWDTNAGSDLTPEAWYLEGWEERSRNVLSECDEAGQAGTQARDSLMGLGRFVGRRVGIEPEGKA